VKTYIVTVTTTEIYEIDAPNILMAEMLKDGILEADDIAIERMVMVDRSVTISTTAKIADVAPVLQQKK